MASVSSSSSVGNTSLKGYGGMVSGIDRDSIIEQMTLGTTTKITNKESEITKLGWKQEAFQSISDKIIDLQDNYLSYGGTANLKNSSLFAKNQFTTLGDSDITRYVSATGTATMADYISIQAVEKLATAASCKSNKKAGSDTNITTESLIGNCSISNLKGKTLKFSTYSDTNGLQNTITFTFPSSYEYEENGETKPKPINYTPTTGEEWEELVEDLNEALKRDTTSFIGSNSKYKLSDVFKFVLESAKDENGSDIKKIKIMPANESKFEEVFGREGYVINPNSSALAALGYEAVDGVDTKKGLALSDQLTDRVKFTTTKDFTISAVSSMNKLEYLVDEKISVTYGGQTKQITFLTEDDLAGLVEKNELPKVDGSNEIDWDKIAKNSELQKKIISKMKDNIQNRLETAFGTDKIKVELESDSKLKFDVFDSSKTLTINSTNSKLQNDVLGLVNGASNKVSLTASLKDNCAKLGFNNENELKTLLEKGIVINGKKLDGVTEDTTVESLLSKINNDKEMGVKATYLESTGEFVLISTETGSGRKIQLDGAAKTLFGGGTSKDGEDAVIWVDYGDGTGVKQTSSSNAFNLAGMKVTVSGTFGSVDGEGKAVDSTKIVRFSAKADVDGVTEKIKKFIEDYNEMVSEIKLQITTKPDSDYGPLTDEQKAEMDETSIKNWEDKAKSGILYSNSTMRDLSASLELIYAKLMQYGVSPNDLEKIGITASDDYSDGGKLIFDEAAFKQAMTDEPELVSNIISGGGTVEKGLAQVLEETLVPYATRYATKNGNSYGRLIEEAGSSKVPLSAKNNEIYRQLETLKKQLEQLKEKLSVEQDRYISQFTTMETLINQYNSQSSYLSSM